MKCWCISRVICNIFGSANANSRNSLLYVCTSGKCCRPWLVIVVHDVHIHVLTAIASVAAPVVEHVVAHVHALVHLCGGSRPKSWHTALVMAHQIVMKTGTATAPVAAISVGTLGMACILQALRDETPLHGGCLVAQNTAALINTPTDGAVVYHDVALVKSAESVPSVSTVYGDV